MMIYLNSGVGITGTTTIARRSDGFSKTVEITTTGTMSAYKIPAVIVFCEDALAKDTIIHSLHAIDRTAHCSFKFIICGSWKNIITSLAGSLLYSDELKESGNTKVLSTVGVIDGDISEEKIATVIAECFEGDGVPEKLDSISKKISDHLINFKIPDSILKMNIYGKPEFNFKAMLEEITEQDIDDILKPRTDFLTEALKQDNKDDVKTALNLESYILKKEKEETLKIIQYSKGYGKRRFRTFRNGRSTTDYHKYFSLLKSSIGNEYYHCYPGPHFISPILFRIICKFNNQRWVEYVSPVTNFLLPVAEQQRERFQHNTYNNEIID
ncbi:hypothetical protein [Enterobacter roggenkampii]|uniref:hypothetical protein n=1 Tax=Enterobacter roggenkampii TaxID=1812935 RepID=UPI0020053AA1|nr:hypothetical protein [Enterobacter roggenkampii]MCK7406569.1 hypothetical protein [Enterobacter roggenkampii]